MVATAATAAFFPVGPTPPGLKPTSTKLRALELDTTGNKTKSLKLNTKKSFDFSSKDGVIEETYYSGSHAHWSTLFAAITTVFLGAEKQWMMLDWKPKRFDTFTLPRGIGRIVEDGFVYRENFAIRSYEIGADRRASIYTLMNHLQETALNHAKTTGLVEEGFGSTREMCKKNLIWVVIRMNLLVDRYPTWGDDVQVDTWISSSGKNGMRRDWVIRDCNAGEILTRASSVWVMMNKLTRRLSKMPDEVRAELSPLFLNTSPVIDENGKKLPKLDDDMAENIHRGLTPRWSDLDVNEHVNNVKYIAWILESAPVSILETHELSSMTLEYRRECGRDSVVQSLTAVSTTNFVGLINPDNVEYNHLLRLEDGSEVVRGKTEWKLKKAKNYVGLGKVLVESA